MKKIAISRLLSHQRRSLGLLAGFIESPDRSPSTNALVGFRTLGAWGRRAFVGSSLRCVNADDALLS